MNFRPIITVLFLIAGLQTFAQEKISLNGTWLFSLAQNDKETDRLSKFYDRDFDTKNFKSIPIPSNWAVLGFEEPVYRGFEGDKASEGFYLFDFKVPTSFQSKRILLNFGGVWSSCEVWLNGNKIGGHQGGYNSFAFDVSGKLKQDTINKLAVRVKQVNHDYKFDVFDDWTLGGIYRDVTLESMPQKRWLEKVVLKTEFDNLFKDADLEISTVVNDKNKETLPGNYPSPGEPYNLRFTLLTKQGKEVMKKDMLIPAHTSTGREVLTTLRIANPEHWTAETPYLYTLKVELLEKNKVTHTRTERVGFRSISTVGGVFKINGQAVKLRGVNRHDEHPDVGRATTKKHWLQDIILMKTANINYIRMAHYPPAKGFIELCDSLGMYVGEEISLGGAGNLMYNPSYSGSVLQRSHETVVRDINRPSIIYWSIGNEDPLTSLHMASIKHVKALDPTRPVLIPWRAEEWLPKEIDILAPHYWQPQEYDQLASHSKRPIISTEYTHAFGVDAFGGLEARWKALTKHPSGTGAAIWMWADQGIKTPVLRPKDKSERLSEGDEYLRIDESGWDGLVDSYRNFTRDYWEAKAVYAQVYPAVNLVSFTQGQKSVDIPIQNDFDFTDLEAVKIAYSIREDEKEMASGTSSIKGKPHSVSTFKLPLDRIPNIQSGKTYYVWLIFSNAKGEEIVRKAVELSPIVEKLSNKVPGEKLSVVKAETVTISAGTKQYIFNPKTGQLLSASMLGKTLLTDLRPTLWRKPGRHDVSVIGKDEIRDAPDLNRYTQSVRNWDVKESLTSVIINATVDYVIDNKNLFTTVYRYTVGADGRMQVNYQISPKVTISTVPIVGFVLKSASELNQLHWFGLGPYDAYPNKQSAPILGVWGGLIKSAETSGTKAIRWVEQSGPSGKIHISSVGYLEHSASQPGTLYILSGVLGRPEKGRKADESVPPLRTDTGVPFVGEFWIDLLNN